LFYECNKYIHFENETIKLIIKSKKSIRKSNRPITIIRLSIDICIKITTLKVTYLKIILLFFISTTTYYSQEDEINTSNNASLEEEEEVSKKFDFPYYLDDLVIVAGLNNGGIYFNKNNSETTYGYGSHFGVEHYQSPGMNLFINYGLHFNNTNFRQRSADIEFSLYRLQAPIFVSYEIPELREFDFRFLLGFEFSYLLNASMSRAYNAFEQASPDFFNYQPNKFSKFDAGLFFGLSVERDNYYFRIGSTINVINLDPNEQGMIHQLHLTLGAFPFRFLRK